MAELTREQFWRDIKALHKEVKETGDLEKSVFGVENIVNKYMTELKERQLLKNWPVSNGWWKGRKWLSRKCIKYNFLESILIELNKCRMRMRQSEQLPNNSESLYAINKNALCYAFIDPKWDEIAYKTGCSVSTLKKYLSALVKVGVLQEFNFGKRGRFFALGYFAKYYDKKNEKEKIRTIKFLNEENSKKLKEFDVKW